MNGNLIYTIGVIALAVGTICTYLGSHIKSTEANKDLKTAISRKDVLIDNLNINITDLKKEQEKLLSLQEDPVVKILPEDNAKGKIGDFELSIMNSGLSDIIDVGIYEDYYVALAEKDSPMILYRFGILSVRPNIEIKHLSMAEDEKFHIQFAKTLTEMQKFYLDKKVKGQRMMIVRIKANYTRKLDGKKFSFSKVFIIAGHGDVLLDYDSSRDVKVDFLPFTFDEVKKTLGVR